MLENVTTVSEGVTDSINISNNSTRSMPLQKKKVAIVGSGLVGKSWAMIFASVGYEVRIDLWEWARPFLPN